MSRFANMSAEEVRAYLSANALAVRDGREIFEACARAYALLLYEREAYDRIGFTIDMHVAEIMDRADAALPDEIKRDLGI